MNTSLLLILITGIFSGSIALAEGCAVSEIEGIEQRLKAAPAPSPTNATQVYVYNTGIINDADLLVGECLKPESFNASVALPLLKMMAHVTTIDLGLQLVNDNRPAYLVLYGKPTGLLRASLKGLSLSERAALSENYRPGN